MQEPHAQPIGASGPGEPEGARRATGDSPGPASGRGHLDLAVPDPEVPEKATRRRFSAAYKLRILKEVDQTSDPGQIGAILRREGLYSSNLTAWRKQVQQGALDALSTKKRGKKPDPTTRRIKELEDQVDSLSDRLRQAEAIIEAQKKISEILSLSAPNKRSSS